MCYMHFLTTFVNKTSFMIFSFKHYLLHLFWFHLFGLFLFLFVSFIQWISVIFTLLLSASQLLLPCVPTQLYILFLKPMKSNLCHWYMVDLTRNYTLKENCLSFSQKITNANRLGLGMLVKLPSACWDLVALGPAQGTYYYYFFVSC